MHTLRTENTGRRSKYALEAAPADWDGYLLDRAETQAVQQALDGLVSALSAAGNVIGEAWLLRHDRATGARLSLRAPHTIVVVEEPGASSGSALLAALVEGASWPGRDAVVVFPLARRCLQWPTFDFADPGTSSDFSFTVAGGSFAVLGFSLPAGPWGPTLIQAATWAAELLVEALVGAWVDAGANAAACDAVGGLRWLNPDTWDVGGDESRATAFETPGRALFAHAIASPETLRAMLIGFSQPAPAALAWEASARQSARALLNEVSAAEAPAWKKGWVQEFAFAYEERAREDLESPARGWDFNQFTYLELLAELENVGILRHRIAVLDGEALQVVRAAVEARHEGLGDLLDKALGLIELEHVVNHPQELEWELEAWIRARVEEAFGPGQAHVTPPAWLVDHLGPYLPDLEGDFWDKLAAILWEVGAAVLAELPWIIGELVADLVAPWVNILRKDLPDIWKNLEEAVSILLGGSPDIALQVSNIVTALLSAAGRIEFSLSMQIWIASTVAGAVAGAGAGGAITGSAAYALLEYVGIALLVMAFLSDLFRVGVLVARLWNEDGTPMDTASDDFADLIATIGRLAMMIVMIPLAFVALRVIGVIGDLLGGALRSPAVEKLLGELFEAMSRRRTTALTRIDGLTDEAANAQADTLVEGLQSALRANDAPDELVDGIEAARANRQGQGMPEDASTTAQTKLDLPNGEEHTLTLATDADGRLVLWMCSGCGVVLRALRDAREAAELKKLPELMKALDELKTALGELQSNPRTEELAKGLEEYRARILQLHTEHGADADVFFAALKSDGVVLAVANKKQWSQWLKKLLVVKIGELPDDRAAFDALAAEFAKIGYLLRLDEAGEIEIVFRWGTADAGAPKLTWDDDKRMVVEDPRGRYGGSNRLSDGSHLRKWAEAPENAEIVQWLKERGHKIPPAGHQGHHLAADEVARKHPLFVQARKKAGYDVDRASNVEMLPTDRELDIDGFSNDLPVHRGSHPEWNKHGTVVANRVLRMMRKHTTLGPNATPEAIAAALTPEQLESAVALVERKLRRDVRNSIHRNPTSHPEKPDKLK